MCTLTHTHEHVNAHRQLVYYVHRQQKLINSKCDCRAGCCCCCGGRRCGLWWVWSLGKASLALLTHDSRHQLFRQHATRCRKMAASNMATAHFRATTWEIKSFKCMCVCVCDSYLYVYVYVQECVASQRTSLMSAHMSTN